MTFHGREDVQKSDKLPLKTGNRWFAAQIAGWKWSMVFRGLRCIRSFWSVFKHPVGMFVFLSWPCSWSLSKRAKIYYCSCFSLLFRALALWPFLVLLGNGFLNLCFVCHFCCCCCCLQLYTLNDEPITGLLFEQFSEASTAGEKKYFILATTPRYVCALASPCVPAFVCVSHLLYAAILCQFSAGVFVVIRILWRRLSHLVRR